MRKTGYFASANKLNIDVNFYSGNIFPLGSGARDLNFFSVLWVIFVSFIKMSYVVSVAVGAFYFSEITPEEGLKKTGSIFAVCIELLINTIHLNLQRENLRLLIDRYNAVLIDSDELRRLVIETVEPYKSGLKFYLTTMLFATALWASRPIVQIFEYEEFSYGNFTVPAYLPGEPFGVNGFVAGVLFQVIGSCYINFGKASVDVYVTHLVAVLSAEYKFLRVQLAEALSEENADGDEAVVRRLQECVRHHCAVMKYARVSLDAESTVEAM